MAATFLIVTSVLGAGSVRGAISDRPNVLLIMPDDLSYSDYSYFKRHDGVTSPRTPNVDQLAASSLRLTDFHVAPTCSPSRAQLLTGRYANSCGVWHTIHGRSFLRANEVTMATVFGLNKYHTALFGKWHLGENYPLRPKDRGFEYTVMIHGGGIDQQPDLWGNRNTAPSVVYEDERPVYLDDRNAALPGPAPGWQLQSGIPLSFVTNYFTSRSIEFMERTSARHEPFFVYLPYNVAHEPDDTPADAREGIDAHSATIENLDKNIGRILRWLDSSGQAENTLLIMILGDNGMSNFMFRGEKGSEYEAGHRVPCLVRWPKHGFGGSIASSRDIPNLTSEIDWLPTLMSLLELRDVPDRSADTDIHGISLVPLLEPTSTSAGGAFKDRVLIVDNQRLDYLRKFKQACVMKDESSTDGRISHKWRLIRNSSDKPWELYDVEGDRWEAQNLLLTATARRTSNLVRDLQASYESWWSRVSAKADDYVSPVAGTSSDPEICLLAHDWHTDAEVPRNQTKIAAGMRTNGFNAVTFFKAGEYVFDLRRWPREIEGETTIASGLRTPIRVFASNALTYGRPLAVRSARIRIWCDHTTYVDARQNVDPREVNSVFKVILPAGPAFIQTWFYDASGSELCGAYYDYVSLKEKVP